MDSVFGVSKKITFPRNGICALTSFSCITLGTVAKAGAVSPRGSMWPCHGDEVPGGRWWGFRELGALGDQRPWCGECDRRLSCSGRSRTHLESSPRKQH